MKQEVLKTWQEKAYQIYTSSGIVLTEIEKNQIEIADFGLNRFEETGLIIVTYVNTNQVCAKELALLPNQTCPEHKHLEKEETFRCRKGKVFLYVEGENTKQIQAKIVEGRYNVFHEIVLEPGEQYTLYPNTWHWFQASGEGAIVSEFSTKSTDEADIFRDEHIIRVPVINLKEENNAIS